MQYPPNQPPYQGQRDPGQYPPNDPTYPPQYSQPLPQQPGQYPQPGPNYPSNQPPRKQNFWTRKVGIPVWLLIVLFFVVAAFGHATATSTPDASPQASSASTATVAAGTTPAATSQPTTPPTPTPKPKPTKAPAWTTTHNYTGSGNKKTETFTAPDDWKLKWSCTPGSFDGFDQYNLSVDVDGSDGSFVDPGAVNELCKTGNASGETEEHQGGQVYLDIESEADWTITVQELK